MRRALAFLLELRVERVTRELLRHAQRHCVGVEEPCPTWTALNVQFDDAWDRLQKVRA